jgi:four helix bundle protein
MDEGYKKLKIYKIAHDLGVKIHKMSLSLPKIETFEEGSQIRRSSKSVSANIVEGYGLRKYKNEYIHFLYRSYASSVETVEHLEYLYETKSLNDEKVFKELLNSYQELNRMLFGFINAVEKQHKMPAYIGDE